MDRQMYSHRQMAGNATTCTALHCMAVDNKEKKAAASSASISLNIQKSLH